MAGLLPPRPFASASISLASTPGEFRYAAQEASLNSIALRKCDKLFVVRFAPPRYQREALRASTRFVERDSFFRDAGFLGIPRSSDWRRFSCLISVAPP